MINHRTIYNTILELAPAELAENWDPIGPTLTWPDDQTTNVVLSLDLTNKALKLAKENGANLIITHHPFLFNSIQNINADNVEQRLLLELAENRITCYAAHTNLDAAIGGVAESFLKVALSGLDLESEIDILIPDSEIIGAGQGRIVNLKQSTYLSTLIKTIEKNLKTVCQTNTDEDQRILRIAVCPGAFEESWIDELVRQKVDMLLVGEIKHHVTVMLHERNIVLAAAGHGASEQTIIPYLADYLRKKIPELNFAENEGIVYNYLRSK